MQKGTRFENIISSPNIDSACDVEHRKEMTPAGNSVAITGPSTQYNLESQPQIIVPEGLSCFGNPTLETLNILNRLPKLDK